MAEWVSDNMYIRISGGNLGAPVEVQARWKKVKIDGAVDPIDVTRGPAQKHKSFKPGMHEYPIEMTLGIDDTSIYPDELHLDQEYTIDIAINGNTQDEPWHKGVYFIESIPVEIETQRGERVYALKLKQYSIAQDMFEGAVVPPGGIV